MYRKTKKTLFARVRSCLIGRWTGHISQANELQTLTQAGVSGINLAAANQSTSSYTTTTGSTRTAQNIDFTTSNFYSDFTDNPTLTATAAGLPQLQGAGFVRDMREAMSLGTAQSQTLEQTITSFKAATTTQDRQALLDQVITAWANTSSMGDAKARNPLAATSLLSSGGGWYVSSPAQAIADFAQKQPALYAQLSALERFNGQPVIERYTRATNASYYDGATGTYKGYTFYSISIEPQRLPFFQTAYDSLKASTYQSLYLQTEGKELLDQIELVIDDKGLRLDFAAVDTTLAQKIATDPSQAATDLAEFMSFTTDSLASNGWDGAAQLGELKISNSKKSNKTRACKRRRCATKLRAAYARFCEAKAINLYEKGLKVSLKRTFHQNLLPQASAAQKVKVFCI